METSAGARGEPGQVGGGRRRLRISLSVKIAGLVGVSSAVVALILAFYFSREAQQMLRQELASRGRLAVLTLANSSSSLLLTQDTAGLEALATATLNDVPGSAYVIVRDDGGHILAEAVRAELADGRPAAGDFSALPAGERVLSQTLTVSGREMIHLAARVAFRGKSDQQYMDPLGLNPAGAGAAVTPLGAVELGFSAAELRDQVTAATRRSMGRAALVFVACVLAIFPFARFTTRPLEDLSRAALGIAAGDLRQRVKEAGNDEVADLGRSFSRMLGELQAMVAELRDSAATLVRESETILGGATRHAASASQQSASLAQMNASIREIAQTSGAALEHADRVLAATRSAEESSRVGEAVVEDAVRSTTAAEQQVADIGSRLGELTGRVGEIGEIIGKVKDLALRTNVLALNAAIHAGRAGEGGSNFTVIAREMRTLAEQSSATAGEVPRLLGQIAECTEAAALATRQGTDQARSTAVLAQRAGATIGSLAGVCRDSASAAQEIADSARQQATGVTEIVAALDQLSRVAQGNVEGSDEMKRMAERLRSVSGRLSALAERYQA